MKKFLVVSYVFISQILFAQTNFERGFNNGFKRGYCVDQYGCISPNPPFVPNPNFGESYENYNQGYDRGFSVGQKQRGIDNSSTNQTNNSAWPLTTTKFPDMELYHPDNDLLERVYAKAAQNNQQQQYQQQQYKNQQDLQTEKLNRWRDENVKTYNSPEARKKRYDDFVNYKNKYDAFKYKPNELENDWYKVVISYSNINGNIPENPGNCKEEWVYVKNNKVVIETDSPDNFKNSDETKYYYPEENRDYVKKDMIDNELTTYLLISKSYDITQGVAIIEHDVLINENGYIRNVGYETDDLMKNGIFVIFIDYLEKCKQAQQCKYLNELKHQKQKKFLINNGWNVVNSNNGKDFCSTREVFVQNGKITKYRIPDRGDIIIDSGGTIVNGKSNIVYTIFDSKSNKIIRSCDILF